MDLLTNATVQVQRRVYNATTKQSTMGTVGPAFPCYIRDMSLVLAERGVSATFTYKLTCDGGVDLRDGDLVVSIVPSPANLPTVVTVQHVAHRFLPDSTDSYKVAHLEADESGSST